jgi:hypothetical protein
LTAGVSSAFLPAATACPIISHRQLTMILAMVDEAEEAEEAGVGAKKQ